MASFHAAAAIGETLIKVLDEAAPRSERLFADTSFVFAKDLKAPPPQGVTLYFYRVATSACRQNFPVRENPDGSRRRHPLVLDLYYLLTGWSREDARRQAALLLWAMRVLEDLNSLPGAVINQRYGTDAPPFRVSEAVQIAFESLTVQDQYNIWDAARHNLQPSIGVIARAVPIETEMTEAVYPPAQTRELQFGPRGGP